MEGTYPIVKFPKDIQNIFDWDPLDEDRPKKPSPPELQTPISRPALPSKPIEPRFEKEGVGYLALFMFPVVVYMFVLSNEKDNTFFGFLGWLFIVVFIIFSIRNSISNSEKEEKYNTEKSKYPQALENWRTECERLDFNYEVNVKRQDYNHAIDYSHYENIVLRQYNLEVEMFEQYKGSYEAKSLTRSRKIRKLIEFSLKSTPLGQYQENKKLTKGVSEQSFFDFLLNQKQKAENFNPDPINMLQFYTDKTVLGSWFLPDVVVKSSIDNQHDIYIDVEIDEPYVGKNGMPIHYISGGDELRDIFFLNNGWIVVRFAEEQIVKNPDECLKFIQRVVAKCTSFGRLDLVEEFMKQMDMPIIKRWTKDEAHAMAFKRYRNTYLEKDFVENLSIEEEKKEPVLQNDFLSKIDTDEDVNLPF